MNTRIVAKILGIVLLIEAALMLLPMTTALLYHESALPFLYSIAILLAAGGALNAIRPKSQDIYAKEGFVCVGAAWILMSAFGALPFVFSGEIPFYIDAFFETVSGFTTTGATILTAVEPMSKGCAFWRLFTHWVGGMGVLVFIMAVLPASGGNYMHIMRAEVPGPTVGKLVPRLRETARILYLIYIALTAMETLLLILGGMSFYEALVHSFATAGTGGFSTRNASIGGFNSAYIEMVIATFMMIFGVNFNIYYLLLLGQFRSVFKSEELRVYLGVILAATVLIAANIASQVGGFVRGLRYSYFSVTTVVSTTGFCTADFDTWPEFSKWLLFLLMFIGGCAGSTGGGMKVSRIIILCKSFIHELKKQAVPSRVQRIWFEDRPVAEETVKSVHVFSLAYILILLICGLVLSLEKCDFITSMTASLACLSNVGPGLSMVGPTGNYAFFSWWSKLMLSFEMLFGRLEIFPLAYLLSPPVWRRR
ncbi:MAG: TrkH family potassium uptake protein [Oscillospiraceae bacterium]|nr:TrkH family potassium uptake protein [Oscillospiraceae bacterium]